MANITTPVISLSRKLILPANNIILIMFDWVVFLPASARQKPVKWGETSSLVFLFWWQLFCTALYALLWLLKRSHLKSYTFLVGNSTKCSYVWWAPRPLWSQGLYFWCHKVCHKVFDTVIMRSFWQCQKLCDTLCDTRNMDPDSRNILQLSKICPNFGVQKNFLVKYSADD